MKTFKVLVLAVIGMMLLSHFAYAELTGQEKLLAKRAATVDAYRNLAEKVNGLEIDSQTYVRDFVAESDQVRASLDTFLKGAKVVSSFYLPDGTCEVEVEIGVEELVVELERIKKQHHFLGHWKTIYFDKLKTYYTNTVVRAKGSGVPRGQGQTVSSIVTENIPGWENVTPQGRLMAQRAALVDAYRNLAESIKGLRIDAQTYVRDFVAESDQIQTDLDTWIKGVEPRGNYHYLPDGICEIEVEVSITQVVEELVKIRKRIRYWQNVRYETIDFKKIAEYEKTEVVRATGSGVPPAGDKVVPQAVSAPDWVSRKETAIGTGIPPKDSDPTEGRLMAERAAKLDALRNLAEKIYGVSIDSQTTVKNFVTQSDQIRADVETFMRGAEVVDTKYLPDGSVQVEVALDLRGVWNIIRRYR